MNEQEAMKAMRQGKKVKFTNSGKKYLGKLVARYGNRVSFLFRGKTEGGEIISYLGKPEEFELVRGRK